MDTHTTRHPAPSLDARRRSITLRHALTGLLTAVWGAGLPALDARLDLGPGMIGAMLLALAACAMLSMRIAGRLLRAGERMLSLAMPAAAGALILAGLSPDTTTLFLAAVLFGLACGAVNVALSSEAMAVESAAGRPVIARMHGFWTLGAAGGGLLLGAALHGGVDSVVAITMSAGIVVLASVLASVSAPRAVAAPHPATPPRPDAPESGEHAHALAPSRARGRGTLIALGLLGAAAFVTEGAATDWAGVHATRVLQADPATGSLVYGVFFSAMTVMRFGGDALRQRLGPLRTVRLTASLAVLGYASVLLSGVVAEPSSAVSAAVAGWALAGAGTALIWPIVIGTLADSGESPGHLATVTMISYGGGLIGPALIGFLAQTATLETALILPAALALTLAFVAPSIIRRFRGIPPHPSPTLTLTRRTS